MRIGKWDPNRKRTLLHEFAKIPWHEVEQEASRLGFLAARRTLQKAAVAKGRNEVGNRLDSTRDASYRP